MHEAVLEARITGLKSYVTEMPRAFGFDPLKGHVSARQLLEQVSIKRKELNLSDEQVLVTIWAFSADMHHLYEYLGFGKLDPQNKAIFNPLSGEIFRTDMTYLDNLFEKIQIKD